ncbi:MAG: RNA polymerase sigma factor [Prolixibacteraceae bacterium]|nr:RNA polymerase sigma factor [Prolixibacteraceae bacterium]
MTAEEFKNKIIPFSRKLYPMLFRILKNEEETRDALQDLMVKLWNRKSDLEKCTNQTAYIITVAKNYSFDLLKKKRPDKIGEKEEYKILNIESGDVHHDIKEKYEHVQKAIENLPEKYRTIIQLRDIDGFSFEEIKGMTGFEIPYLRVILSRARLKVKQEVEKIYDYDKTREIAQQIL